MSHFFEFLLDFLAQFAGGRGPKENELVRFGLAILFWGALLAVAGLRQRQHRPPREKLLVWGFSLGLGRELLMFCILSLQILDVVEIDSLHAFFPPIEHTLLLASTVVVAAAFMRYILDNPRLTRWYLIIGLGTAVLCYFITFRPWTNFITVHPESEIGLIWCAWVFHLAGCVLILIPFVLLIKKRGWLRDVVLLALLFFFLDDFLMLVNLSTDHVYSTVLEPICNSLHLWAIPLLGFVYWREQSLERGRLEEDLLEISDREKRSIGQNLHDALVQNLAGIAFLSKLMANNLKKKSLAQSKDAMEITKLLQSAIDQTRGIARGLYPIQIEEEGWMAALEEFANHTTALFKVPCEFQCDYPVDLPDIEYATHVYRIVQEAVNNAIKHGKPEKIIIDVTQSDGRILVSVRSRGKKSPPSDRKTPGTGKGMGMRIMKYRASMIGASLDFQFHTKDGSLVTCAFQNPETSEEPFEGMEGVERKYG